MFALRLRGKPEIPEFALGAAAHGRVSHSITGLRTDP